MQSRCEIQKKWSVYSRDIVIDCLIDDYFDSLLARLIVWLIDWQHTEPVMNEAAIVIGDGQLIIQLQGRREVMDSRVKID